VDVDVVVDMVVDVREIFAKVLIVRSTWLPAFESFSSTSTSTTRTTTKSDGGFSGNRTFSPQNKLSAFPDSD
jgi:hypothetical protein